MILLWDVDTGLSQLDKYFHSNDNHVIAGALLGVGIVNCNIKNECDPVSCLYCLLCRQNCLYVKSYSCLWNISGSGTSW